MFEIDGFIAECLAALSEARPALAVDEVLQRTVSRPNDIDSALGVPVAGGYRLLWRSPDLTILQNVWQPRIKLLPHDHRMWGAIGIYGGGEDNVFYRRTPSGLTRSDHTDLRPGGTITLPADVIHSVANPFATFTAALHVYGGDLLSVQRSKWNSTGDEEPFDYNAVEEMSITGLRTESP